MKITSKKIAKAVDLVIKDGMDQETVLNNLLKYFNENNLNYLMPKVLKYLEEINLKNKESETCKIFTAHEINDSLINDIKEKLKISSSENKIQINPSLIGGFVLEHNGLKYDASISHAIKKMKELLVN